MSRRLILAGVLFTLFASLAAAQDAKTVIAAASKAMGADTLNTIEFSGSGADFAIGQAYNGKTPTWPKFIDKTTHARSISACRPRKWNRIRMQGENPPRGGGQQPVRGEQPQNQTIVCQREHAVGAAARDRDGRRRASSGPPRPPTPR
jgi:hypothetical protein